MLFYFFLKESNFCDCEDVFFLPTEVAMRNTPNDCWVSYFNGVYDITKLCSTWYDKPEIRPILAHAGKDISHWFDYESGDVKYRVHPVTGIAGPYCPHGPIPDLDESSCHCIERCPWWLNETYRVGSLTVNPRTCKILNTLISREVIILVTSFYD